MLSIGVMYFNVSIVVFDQIRKFSFDKQEETSYLKLSSPNSKLSLLSGDSVRISNSVLQI